MGLVKHTRLHTLHCYASGGGYSALYNVALFFGLVATAESEAEPSLSVTGEVLFRDFLIVCLSPLLVSAESSPPPAAGPLLREVGCTGVRPAVSQFQTLTQSFILVSDKKKKECLQLWYHIVTRRCPYYCSSFSSSSRCSRSQTPSPAPTHSPTLLSCCVPSPLRSRRHRRFPSSRRRRPPQQQQQQRPDSHSHSHSIPSGSCP